MKKIILSLIITILIVSSIACDDKLNYISTTKSKTESADGNFEYVPSDDTPFLKYNAIKGDQFIKYHDGYLFIIKSLQPFIRMNISNGNISYVHTDPLCDHNTTDCPLYGMQEGYYYLYGDRVFFRKYLATPTDNGYKFWGGFVSYNMSSGKVNVLSEEDDPRTNTEFTRQLYVDNYRFFYDYVYSEKLDKHIFQICRMDLDTGKVVVLGGENNIDDVHTLFPSSLNERFLFALDSRIYLTDINTIYSTDFNLENKKIHAHGKFLYDILTDGEYIYYGTYAGEDDTSIINLRRMKLDGTDDTDLHIRTEEYMWELTDNFIYYTVPDRKKIGVNRIPGYGDDINTPYNEIRRSAHDGSNNETAFRFDGDYTNYYIIGGICAVGNYIYGNYMYWQDKDGNGVFEQGEEPYECYNDKNYNIMRIDITTGKVTFIKVDVK